MTGPVERVPLTDEQLDEWDDLVGSVNRRLEAVPGMPGEWHVMDGVHRCATTHGLHSAAEDAALFAKAAPLVTRLLAELRASRAREQQLQQRIGKARALAERVERLSHGSVSDYSKGRQLAAQQLGAALTRTEAIRSMADPDRAVD